MVMAAHRKPIEINAKGKKIVNRRFNPNYRDGMSGEEMDRFLETESIKVTASARRGGEFYWYLKLEPFLEIEREGEMQRVVGKRDPAGLRSKHAFIRQFQDGSEEVYLVPTPDLQDILLDRFREKIGNNSTRRFADPSSTYVTLYPENLEGFIVR
jgi:hypothetical protein